MKKIILFISIVLISSCSSTPKLATIDTLTGYWEITAVHAGNTPVKEYNMNTVIDYFKVDSAATMGYRKKMAPRFDGKYTTSDDAQGFTIEKRANDYHITYTHQNSSWTEDIIALSSNELTIQTEDKRTYTYKRYTPISISKDGQAKK